MKIISATLVTGIKSHVQICDNKRGTLKECLMLWFVYFKSIFII